MNPSDDTRPEDIRHAVAQSYARAVATPKPPRSSCCGGTPAPGALTALAGYDRHALLTLPADAVVHSFGCGDPVALAAIREGDTVLDLGSGAGIDLLLAARLVGPTGHVIGIDMTPTMVERARANVATAGFTNVVVREGLIEDLPVADATVDLVISNCVINLSPEKSRVFAEIARVLRPGGRFSISDIVAAAMPEWAARESRLYAACVAGAIPEPDYVAGLQAAGLEGVTVQDRLIYDEAQLHALFGAVPGESCCGAAGAVPQATLRLMAHELAGQVASIRVTGHKPS